MEWKVGLELPLGISLTGIVRKLDDQMLSEGVEKQWNKSAEESGRKSVDISKKRYKLNIFCIKAY